MDRRERYYDPEETLRTALAGFQAGIWTALPCIVQSFDAAAMTVVVQPTIKARVTAEDGAISTIALPLLLDCPVIYPCGGGFTLTFPIVAGDECLVMFASRCIDSWWQSGGIQEQAELRMHDLSDGFALVGVRSQPRVITGISLDAPQLRSDDGTSYVEVAGDTITINTTAQIIANAPDVVVNCDTAEVNAEESITVTSPLSTFVGNVIVQGALTVQGLFTFLAGLVGSGGSGAAVEGNLIVTSGNVTADGVGLKTHHHTGVQTGSGNTGGPVG